MHDALLAPSLLAGDHANLAASAREITALGLPCVHLDIMDGHFVPNLSFGPETLAALRRAGCRLFFDTHLMLSEPNRYVDAFAQAGADRITIHIEPAYDQIGTLLRIRQLKRQAGIALNPATPAAAVEALLAQVDLVLVMTVQPGFGGQAFRPEMLPKIEALAAWRRERNLRLPDRGGRRDRRRERRPLPGGRARTSSWSAPRFSAPPTAPPSRPPSPASERPEASRTARRRRGRRPRHTGPESPRPARWPGGSRRPGPATPAPA